MFCACLLKNSSKRSFQMFFLSAPSFSLLKKASRFLFVKRRTEENAQKNSRPFFFFCFSFFFLFFSFLFFFFFFFFFFFQSLGTMSVLHRVKHASENCVHLAYKEKQARHVTRFLWSIATSLKERFLKVLLRQIITAKELVTWRVRSAGKKDSVKECFLKLSLLKQLTITVNSILKPKSASRDALSRSVAGFLKEHFTKLLRRWVEYPGDG